MSADRIAPPAPSLFPDSATRKRVEDRLTRAVAEAAGRIQQGPVTLDTDDAELRRELAAFDFAQPRPLENLVDWLIARLGSDAAHATLIEEHLIRSVALRLGLPEGSGGYFTTSRSEANSMALVCALTCADARYEDEGVRAFHGPVAIYVSRECEDGWEDIAHRSGIGRSALRPIETDGAGCMDVPALAEAIRDDRRHGTVPVLIAATVGTIGSDVIDPLEPCATVARECNIWYHIDAACGVAALCAERLRSELAGVELADSVTVDAHEGLATTVGCAMLIARESSILSEALRIGAHVQSSCRFAGLKLFLWLAAAGWEGYGAYVRACAKC